MLGKENFEKWIWEKVCVDISQIHSDNGVFASYQLRFYCDNKHQEQSFSGFGAQYQNAITEREIQTIMYVARTFIFQYSLHWTDHGSDEISLWSFSIKHTVYLHNFLPNFMFRYHTTRVAHQQKG